MIDAELGMFSARDEVDFSLQRGSIQRAHEEAWYWFSPRSAVYGGLTRPRLQGRARTRAVRKSLFWFTADAAFWNQRQGSVVYRARQLAQVLTDAGVEIREIHSEDPGKVVWEDGRQVLARPTAPVPKAFGPDR